MFTYVVFTWPAHRLCHHELNLLMLTHLSRVCKAVGLPCQGHSSSWVSQVSLLRGLQSYSQAANPGSSAELIAKWQNILQGTRQEGPDGSNKSEVGLHKEQLRQLCQDAIHVYSSEGASTVVPDRVTEVFMAAYEQLQAPQHKLQFFKLLATDFGVQRSAIDEAVHLWLQRAPAAPPQAKQAGRDSTADSQANSGFTSSPVSSSGSPAAKDPGATALTYRLAERLTAACQPLYMQLLLPVSQHKSGIQFLVNLRADLLTLLKEQPAAELSQQGVALRALDQDLRSALARWFSLGLLQLQRITWEASPGLLLQRVQQTEAVHKMQHLEELQRRLQQSDRRVFAFMHPSLPGEPLVVLHTAIMDHIPCSMEAVLAQQQQNTRSKQPAGGSSALSSIESSTSDPTTTTTSSRNSSGNGTGAGGSSSSNIRQAGSVACFYSISSSQKGLAGVDLGNFLIKKAAKLLLSELPQLKTLVTLSPIPGFRPWLITRLRQACVPPAAGSEAAAAAGVSNLQASLLKDVEVTALLDLRGNSAAMEHTSITGSSSAVAGNKTAGSQAAAAEVLLGLVESNQWDCLPQQQQEEVLRPVLVRLCAVYLLLEKRRNFALDPVAHFHLRNGAQLWRINWRADMSPQGLANSCGLMVNYFYDMAAVASNNQHYLVEHHINASQAVQQLL